MATFGYGRVSTGKQTTENQRLELERAGHKIDYWHQDDGVPGKIPAKERPAFSALLTKIRDGETLVVAKLDRLGRDALDVLETVHQLEARGIKVVVQQLGATDLTSPAGRLLLTMLAAVAELERGIICERIHSGLERARSEGKTLGRRPKLQPTARNSVRARIEAGETTSALAREYKVSRATILACR